MRFSKEIITGIITIASVAFLIAGVNFLKGNSFFGGDRYYEAYFPNSAGVTPAASVFVNGVVVGKVLEVNLTNDKDSLRKVKMKFNITDDNFKIPKNAVVEAGSTDLFTKGLIIRINDHVSKGFYEDGAEIQGIVLVDLTSQVKEYADPISQKVQAMMVSIDKMVNGISSFWDTTATSEIESSLKEVKVAIRKFGNAADQIEGLLLDERVRLSRIMANVESITLNLKRSNDSVKAIVGNVKRITDELVTSDFKGVIENAKSTLHQISEALATANSGEGTLGKLLSDDGLYLELIQTNKDLQELVDDITIHPERYIHFSVLGAKTKGVRLTNKEEKKLKNLLDSIPDN